MDFPKESLQKARRIFRKKKETKWWSTLQIKYQIKVKRDSKQEQRNSLIGYAQNEKNEAKKIDQWSSDIPNIFV